MFPSFQVLNIEIGFQSLQTDFGYQGLIKSWIGSYFGGVNYYPRSYTHFEKYYPQGEENSLHGKRVREFCRDNYGVLWIGTEDEMCIRDRQGAG